MFGRGEHVRVDVNAFPAERTIHVRRAEWCVSVAARLQRFVWFQSRRKHTVRRLVVQEVGTACRTGLVGYKAFLAPAVLIVHAAPLSEVIQHAAARRAKRRTRTSRVQLVRATQPQLSQVLFGLLSIRGATRVGRIVAIFVVAMAAVTIICQALAPSQTGLPVLWGASNAASLVLLGLWLRRVPSPIASWAFFLAGASALAFVLPGCIPPGPVSPLSVAGIALGLSAVTLLACIPLWLIAAIRLSRVRAAPAALDSFEGAARSSTLGGSDAVRTPTEYRSAWQPAQKIG